MSRYDTPVIFTVVLSIMFVILLASFIFSRGGVIDTIQKVEQISQIKDEILRMEKLNNEKAEKVRKLKSDENYRKSVVKGLGFEVDEGEYVFRFEKNDSEQLLINPRHQKNTTDIVMFLIALIILQLIVFVIVGVRMILDIFWR